MLAAARSATERRRGNAVGPHGAETGLCCGGHHSQTTPSFKTPDAKQTAAFPASGDVLLCSGAVERLGRVASHFVHF